MSKVVEERNRVLWAGKYEEPRAVGANTVVQETRALRLQREARTPCLCGGLCLVGDGEPWAVSSQRGRIGRVCTVDSGVEVAQD